MHFDPLDESYAMVNSNMHFDEVTFIGMTGLCIRVRPVRPVMPILIINTELAGSLRALIRLRMMLLHIRY